jgi:chemotaxis protein histidine kinase CheA
MAPEGNDNDNGNLKHEGVEVVGGGQAAPAVVPQFPALPDNATLDDRLARLENFQQTVVGPLTTMAQAALDGNALLRDLIREWRTERLAEWRDRRTTPVRRAAARRHSDSTDPEDDVEDEDGRIEPAQARAAPAQARAEDRVSAGPEAQGATRVVVPKVLNLHLPTFDGQKDQALGWLYSVEDRFDMAVPPLEDRAKIVQISSALTGNALVWYTAYRKSPHTPQWLTSYKDFRKAFLRAFTDPLEDERAQNEFDVLRQTGSVTDYTTAFDRLRTQIGLGDSKEDSNPLLVHKYLVGLKVPIQRQLQRSEEGPPKTLRRLVRHAERIDIQEARIKDMQQHAQAANKSTEKSTSTKDSNTGGNKKSQSGQTSAERRPTTETSTRSNRAESTAPSSTNTRPQTRSQTQSSTVKCYNCNGFGHIAKECTEPCRPRASDTNNLSARGARIDPVESDDETFVRDTLHPGN